MHHACRGCSVVAVLLQGLMLMAGGCQLRVGSYDDVGGWDAAPPGANDAMLRWLEHYAEALHQRLACCQLEPLRPETRISLFPVKPPWQVPLPPLCGGTSRSAMAGA